MRSNNRLESSSFLVDTGAPVAITELNACLARRTELSPVKFPLLSPIGTGVKKKGERDVRSFPDYWRICWSEGEKRGKDEAKRWQLGLRANQRFARKPHAKKHSPSRHRDLLEGFDFAFQY